MIYSVLFTSPGRRVELIQLFKENFPKDSNFYGTDFDSTSPASYLLDKVFKVQYEINDKYAEKILDICINNKINLVIPLIDPDLLCLSKIQKRFSENNINLMLSSYDRIGIAYDKFKTYQFLNEINLPTFKTCLASDTNLHKLHFPIILKPRKGSSGKGVVKIENGNELKLYTKNLTNEFILQEYMEGEEITVSIYGDEKGICYEAIQRKRLKIRGGEVERGVTIKNNNILTIVRKFVKEYRPKGAINIQIIVNNEKYKILEINPRFGGGYPLAHKAGANFPRLLLNELLGKKNKPNIGNYTENLYMFRFDKAIYTKDLIELC